MEGETRRDALKIIGAIGATCSFPFSANELYGQHVHAEHAEEEPNAPEPREPQFFTPSQFSMISRLADLIVPTTDTPGAVAAGVPHYIDLVVAEDPKLQAVFRGGLRRLEKSSQANYGSPFRQLSENQQIELLEILSEASQREKEKKGRKKSAEASFFLAIKNLTADGYYTSRIGLLQELGYNGNTALAEFPGHNTPEH